MRRFVIALLALALAAPPAFATETVRDGAREVGRGFKEMGQAVGQAARRDGKAVGQAFREAGIATGKAFRELGRDIRKEFTGR